MSHAGPFHAQGVYRCHCVTMPLPTDRVQEMIPKGLVPGAQSLTPPRSHPVFLMFGRHFGVKLAFLPGPGSSYQELVVAIPFLDRPFVADPYRGPFSYMPRLYLDHWLWVVAGWLYGYPKERANISAVADHYEVSSYLGRQPIISAEFTAPGAREPASALAHFAAVAPALNLPFIARWFYGPFISSWMTFKLDQATLRSITAQIDIVAPFLRGLPLGPFACGGIADSQLGSFSIEVPWTLSLPFGVESLPPKKGSGS